MTFENLRSIQFSKDQIVIAVSHSTFGAGHLGVCFHSAKEGPKLWHLAWHQMVKLDSIPDQLGSNCWAGAVLNVPPIMSKQLVAFIRAAASKSPTISYGLDFLGAKGSFAPNGAYKPPKGSDGLTCSSFVLEILRGGAANLIKSETWRESVENRAWAEKVCQYLRDPDHVASVRKKINGLRLRPFEVAGASQIPHKQWPVDFDRVQAPAQQVEIELNQVCPPTGP
jgi:hypothetical protein